MKIKFIVEKQRENKTVKKGIKSSIKELIVVFLTFTLISCFFMQPFKIPSGSMIPTLLVGDFLVVDKYSYGYTNDSFRMWQFTFPLPKFKNRLMASTKPQQGDVIVFRNTQDQDKNYIKRIIGMPGDKIQIIDGIVHINDNHANGCLQSATVRF